MELLAITPTQEPTTGWGQYSNAVIERLSDRFDLRVRDDLPSPMEMITRPDRLARAVREIRETVRGVDAIFSMVAFPYSLVAYLATRGSDTPYFVACHGTYAVAPLHYPAVYRVARRSFTEAAQLFVASSFTANRMENRIPDLDTVTVVPNGVDMADFEPVEPYDLDHDVSLSVGAFKPRKGQRVTVKAFARVAGDFPDLEHHFVGPGTDSNYANRVRRIARKRNIEDRIHFEGLAPGKDLDRWYASAKVFVLPSQYIAHHFEGYGIVYLEANRHGTPVIGPNDCGAIDAIAHGTSGLCVDNDVESFAAALREILGNEEHHEELSRGAREWAREHTWDHTGERIAEGLEEYTSQSSPNDS